LLYRRILEASAATLQEMDAVDAAIDALGGWPAAFVFAEAPRDANSFPLS
jgi:hypothetical protein